jgi:hypothetical protein
MSLSERVTPVHRAGHRTQRADEQASDRPSLPSRGRQRGQAKPRLGVRRMSRVVDDRGGGPDNPRLTWCFSNLCGYRASHCSFCQKLRGSATEPQSVDAAQKRSTTPRNEEWTSSTNPSLLSIPLATCSALWRPSTPDPGGVNSASAAPRNSVGPSKHRSLALGLRPRSGSTVERTSAWPRGRLPDPGGYLDPRRALTTSP